VYCTCYFFSNTGGIRRKKREIVEFLAAESKRKSCGKYQRERKRAKVRERERVVDSGGVT